MLFDAVILYFNDFHNTFRINNFDSYDEDIQSSTIIIHNILFMAGLVHVDSYILLVVDWYQKNQIPILDGITIYSLGTALPGVQGTKAVVLTITKEIFIPETFDYLSNAFCVAGDIVVLKQELDFKYSVDTIIGTVIPGYSTYFAVVDVLNMDNPIKGVFKKEVK